MVALLGEAGAGIEFILALLKPVVVLRFEGESRWLPIISEDLCIAKALLIVLRGATFSFDSEAASIVGRTNPSEGGAYETTVTMSRWISKPG